MPHLYTHKTKGWRVIYRVHFPDGTRRDKVRWAKKKATAQLILKEITGLEDLSRRGALPRNEAAFYLNRKYVTIEEAERLAAGPVPGSRSWHDLQVEYERYSLRHCRPHTHSCNLSRAGMLMKARLGHIQPAELSEKDIKDYIERRYDEGIKSATIAKEINTLRKLLDPLGVDANPARKVATPRKRDERLPRNIREDELLAFLKALRGRRRFLRGYLRPLALTYLYAGLRPSELVNLTPRDVDIRAGRILIQGKDGYRTKTGYARSVDIHPKLAPHIKACLRKGGRWLFGGDDKIVPNSLGRAIRHTIKEAGIEDITPYSLRHSFITALLRAGADVREVMELAGHRRLDTTLRYLHVAQTEDPPVHRINFGRKRKKGS